MTEYNNTNFSAATDGLRPMHLQQRQPPIGASNNQPPPVRSEGVEAVGQSRAPVETSERVARLERMPESEMQSLVNQANLILQPRNLELVYRRHEGTNRYFLTMYDRDTNEVAREIPPEWSLDMLARIWELTGIFMNERG